MPAGQTLRVCGVRIAAPRTAIHGTEAGSLHALQLNRLDASSRLNPDAERFAIRTPRPTFSAPSEY